MVSPQAACFAIQHTILVLLFQYRVKANPQRAHRQPPALTATTGYGHVLLLRIMYHNIIGSVLYPPGLTG